MILSCGCSSDKDDRYYRCGTCQRTACRDHRGRTCTCPRRGGAR